MPPMRARAAAAAEHTATAPNKKHCVVEQHSAPLSPPVRLQHAAQSYRHVHTETQTQSRCANERAHNSSHANGERGEEQADSSRHASDESEAGRRPNHLPWQLAILNAFVGVYFWSPFAEGAVLDDLVARTELEKIKVLYWLRNYRVRSHPYKQLFRRGEVCRPDCHPLNTPSQGGVRDIVLNTETSTSFAPIPTVQQFRQPLGPVSPGIQEFEASISFEPCTPGPIMLLDAAEEKPLDLAAEDGFTAMRAEEKPLDLHARPMPALEDGFSAMRAVAAEESPLDLHAHPRPAVEDRFAAMRAVAPLDLHAHPIPTHEDGFAETRAVGEPLDLHAHPMPAVEDGFAAMRAVPSSPEVYCDMYGVKTFAEELEEDWKLDTTSGSAMA